jgi:integrase
MIQRTRRRGHTFGIVGRIRATSPSDRSQCAVGQGDAPTHHRRDLADRRRHVPICDELADLLLPFHAGQGLVLRPDKPYEVGKRYRWDFRGEFEACCLQAGLDLIVVTPHVLRHTFASTAAQQGVSLYKIAAWMGHSQSDVTELYAHLAAYDDDINRLNPSVKPKRRRQLRLVK